MLLATEPTRPQTLNMSIAIDISLPIHQCRYNGVDTAEPCRNSDTSPHNPRDSGGTPFTTTHNDNTREATTMVPVLNQKLRILVLKHLSVKPRAGYGLIKDIYEHTGWKPSYGSVYPLLDQLKREGLVKAEEDGKKKVYHLTQKGKEAADAISFNHDEVVKQLDNFHKLTLHVCGIKKDPIPLATLLPYILNPSKEFKELLKKSVKMRQQFARLMEPQLLQKHYKEIDSIIDRAIADLKRLR